MIPALDDYLFHGDNEVLTPALLVYPEKVQANIRATLAMANGDANRWRPHVKTAKLPYVMRQMMDAGVNAFKCSTTLELLALCDLGARDVLLAFPVVGANAHRLREIAAASPRTSVSVLAEDADQIAFWRDSAIGVFLDVNPGMDRTGIAATRTDEIVRLAKLAGERFRGLHFYDGQFGHSEWDMREKAAREGYGQVTWLIETLQRAGVRIAELITSGTPVAPVALRFEPFNNAPFVHRVSPGTVIYNDTTSLHQLAGFDYEAAVLVLSTVVSHPAPGIATCDAGHKAVSVDSGVPNCAVLGWEALTPQKPSEEHLPLRSSDVNRLPPIGELLYLLPRHVCPTVNNFDEALLVVDGQIRAVEAVAARGHERPIAVTASI